MSETKISNCSHHLIRDDNGEIVMNNGNVVLLNKSTNEVVYVPVTEELSEIFGFHILEEVNRNILYNEPSEPLNEANSSASATENRGNVKWTHRSTLRLLDLYKSNEDLFTSTTMKNISVYQRIADSLKNEDFIYSSTQCKDRIKYLKIKYMKFKDNSKRSGASTQTFEYLEEMDSIFGHKPNVLPVAIAANLQPQLADAESASMASSISEDILTDSSLPSPVPSSHQMRNTKRKCSINDAEAIERRHQERLAMQERGIDAFKEGISEMKAMFATFLEKL